MFRSACPCEGRWGRVANLLLNELNTEKVHHQMLVSCREQRITARIPALLHPLYRHNLHTHSNCHLKQSTAKHRYYTDTASSNKCKIIKLRLKTTSCK